MNNVTFNRKTDQVTGRNRSVSPFEYAVSLPYELQLSKIVTEVIGQKEVVNEETQEIQLVNDEMQRVVSFYENPYLFNYDEVLEAKKAALQANNLRKLVYYDEDFPLENFSTDLASYAANMGDGILALHPNGQARTEKLSLGSAAKAIQIYTEMHTDIKVEVGATASNFVELQNGIAELPSSANEVYVRFTNTSDRYRDIYAFGILI